jgi:hypothetical protein
MTAKSPSIAVAGAAFLVVRDDRGHALAFTRSFPIRRYALGT